VWARLASEYKAFHGDLAAICADLKAIQASSNHSIVRLPAKRIEPARKPSLS